MVFDDSVSSKVTLVLHEWSQRTIVLAEIRVHYPSLMHIPTNGLFMVAFSIEIRFYCSLVVGVYLAVNSDSSLVSKFITSRGVIIGMKLRFSASHSDQTRFQIFY